MAAQLCQKLIRQVLDMTSSGKMKWVDFEVQDLRNLAVAAREFFAAGSSLIEVAPGVNICGDLHGQLPDLIRIFERIGYPPKARYVFMGDLVDRGSYNLEILALLFAYQILYPTNVIVLRGNHESESLTRVYGFYDEVKRRYNVSLWKQFVGAFDQMPLAAVVGDRIFCAHGGLSPHLNSLDDIRNIERPCDIDQPGLPTDLLWSDPDQSGQVETFGPNEERGVSYLFGREAVNTFLKKNGLDLVCRAHEVCDDGYQFHFDRKVITIFSSPNYCGELDNSSAVLTVDEKLLCKLQVFEPVGKSQNANAGVKSDCAAKTPGRKKGSPRRASPKRVSPKTASTTKRSSPRASPKQRAKGASPRRAKLSARRKTPKV